MHAYAGVVVACWQVLPEGGEPALLRAALSKALPDAPPKDAQMVKEPAMLHTTLARLLQPRLPDAGSSSSSGSGSSRTSGGNSGDSSSYAARSGRELREATRGGGSSGTHARRMEAAAGLSGVGGAGEKAEVDGGSTLPHINGTAVVEVVTQLSHSLCGLTTTFHQASAFKGHVRVCAGGLGLSDVLMQVN